MKILNKIKSVKLCLIAHPDNQEHSEFADRISDLEEIENELSKDNWIKIESEEDLPKETDTYWFVSRITGKIMKDYFTADSKVSAFHNCQFKLYSHYQPIIEPNAPTT